MPNSEERVPEAGAGSPSRDAVREALLAFAALVQRLDDSDRLLGNLNLINGKLGDLRRLLFEYEVRGTRYLTGGDPDTGSDDPQAAT